MLNSKRWCKSANVSIFLHLGLGERSKKTGNAGFCASWWAKRSLLLISCGANSHYYCETEEAKMKLYEEIFENEFNLDQLVLAHTPLRSLEELKPERTLVIGREKKRHLGILEK